MRNDTPGHLAPQPRREEGESRLSRQIRLWTLLGERVNLYTMGQSSSLRAETVRALLDSVLFTLGLDPEEPEVLSQLPPGALGEAYQAGIRRLERKTVWGRHLWQAVCTGLPAVENSSMTETLRSIGAGWEHYEVQRFAQEFPCEIDYPLCSPVSERLLGVEYVNEYLRRLRIENGFLRRFNAARLARLLEADCPKYRELPVNLFEPAAAAAVGLGLTGGDTAGLTLSRAQYDRLRRLLEPLPVSGMRTALRDGALRCAEELGASDEGTRDYLAAAAEAMAPRVRAALDGGGLKGVFPSPEAGR
ncbi:MAG: DUF6179 domain-containing protein [Oscillibacter sp.]|jgi:hypothetical protein|nr:DUF6179 domain-containing protein [Oscillibacter sp.]